MREVNDFAVNVKLVVKGKAHEDPVKENAHTDTETNNEITMGDMVGDGKRIAFISGITGMGKSVIAKRIVYSWANEEMYKNFTLCLYFKCRELNFFKQDSGNLAKIELLQRFIRDRMPGCDIPTDGDGLLIVIDGLGELFDLKEENSIIYEFLNKRRQFRKSSLIITGQPSLEDLFNNPKVDIGECQIVDIQPLSEENIDTYIEKFSMYNGEQQSSTIKELIQKNIKRSRKIVPMLGVPQILNSICCLVVLHLLEEVESKVEIFTSILYAVLRHVYSRGMVKENPSVVEVFTKYKESFVLFCKFVFQLFKENRFTFSKREMQGEFQEIFRGQSEFEQLFVKNLFLEIPDELEDQFELKYGAVMEFLAAIHVCAGSHVKELESEGLNEVLKYACDLYGACLRDKSIIRRMFESLFTIETLELEQKAKSFLIEVQHLLHSNPLKHIELITFLPKDVKDKKFLQNMFSDLRLVVPQLSEEIREQLIKIREYLINCGCNEDEVKFVFSNVEVKSLTVKGRVEILKIARYFKHINSLIVSCASLTGDDLKLMEETFMHCKEVHLIECEFKDIQSDGGKASRWTLEQFKVTSCAHSESCFSLIGKWGASSELFVISNMVAPPETWMILLEGVKMKKTERALKLKKLTIQHCGRDKNCDFRSEVRISVTNLVDIYRRNCFKALKYAFHLSGFSLDWRYGLSWER